MRIRFILAIGMTLAIAICVAGSLYAGHVLTASARAHVGVAPAELKATEVSFPSHSGHLVKGWFSAGRAGKGAVLLLHPVRSNRTAMLDRALYLNSLGYAVLLVDLQAHGETSGERITFGYREGKDAEASVAELRRRAPGERLGAIGVSLGAASLVLSDAHSGLQAVVLESMYSTIEDAVKDRLALHLGGWARELAHPLLWQLKPRLGISATDLRPIERVAAVRSPVLVVHGTKDQHTTLDEARSIYGRIRSEKSLYLVEGASHVDLYRFAPREYEQQVARFFSILQR